MRKSIISELGKQFGITPVKETEETTETPKAAAKELDETDEDEADETDEVEESDGVDETEQAKKAVSEARKKFETPADEILSPDVPDNEDFLSLFAEIGKKLEEKADEAVSDPASAEDAKGPEDATEGPNDSEGDAPKAPEPPVDQEPPEPPADQEPTDSEDHEGNPEDEDDDELDELAAPTFGPTPEPASLPPFPLPLFPSFSWVGSVTERYVTSQVLLLWHRSS